MPAITIMAESERRELSIQYLGKDLDLMLFGFDEAELGLILSVFLMVPHSASVVYIFWRVCRAWQMFMSFTSSMKTSENPQDLDPSSLVRMNGWKLGGKLLLSV